MYDIRQFKPALYVLILLSIAGFAVAAESVTMWALGTAAVLLNARLVRKNLFKAMPRLASNLVTIGALLYVVHEVLTTGATAVLMIGEFLMLLQVVKLWEQRGNRDYAQLLVLSLLLMVAAAISTASIVFGLMLVAFLFLSLYCCLLFHLKVETDAARESTAAPLARKPSPAIVRQDQRHLTQSMRKLTILVSGVSIVFAVAVFILFPRGTGAGMLGPVQFKANQSLVGFTDEVGFQNIARIQQNDEIIAQVKLSHNGQVVKGGFPLVLRGVTLDAYTGKEGGWRWIRWPRQGYEDVREGFNAEPSSDNEPPGIALKGEVARERTQNLMDIPEPTDVWSQEVMLHPTGTDVLFAMAGPYRITPHQTLSFRFSGRDFELRNAGLHDREHPPDVFSYEVLSTNQLGNTPPPVESGTDPREGGIIAKEIRDYAIRPDVSGTGTSASLGAERYERFRKQMQSHPGTHREPAVPDDMDEIIARNIEHHLKTNFGYTLDLTDTRRIEGRDPMVAFLYDFKKGHCEYFAGAMTLMCQSLGMRARICAGFRSDEYNSTPGANWYIIRQSHAHAWVEVLTKKGWVSFDPTSEDDAAEQAKRAGFMQNIRHLFNFLEYTYGHAVIAYSNEDRSNLIQRTESLMFRATLNTSMTLDSVRRLKIESLLADKSFLAASSRALAVIIALAAAGVPFLIAWFAWERWRLRQRAARIGIDSLPHDRQVRLALQLKFYDDLLQLLGRHRMSRKPHQTPLEFSRSLLTLPADAYETVRRLTELFYRVRYGDGVLTAGRQRHLGVVIERLAGELDSRRA